MFNFGYRTIGTFHVERPVYCRNDFPAIHGMKFKKIETPCDEIVLLKRRITPPTYLGPTSTVVLSHVVGVLRV